MAWRTGVLILAIATLPTAASAQRLEASVSAGYTGSEGIDTDDRTQLGQLYNSLTVDRGSSVNATFGVLFTGHAEAEFLWARQTSRLGAKGAGGRLPLSDLSIYNYLFNFVYNLGDRDARARPYLLVGVGATNYSFGNSLAPVPAESIDSETRFSTNWGGGVKFYLAPNIGLKVGLRWTPTLVRSDPAGIWCDPFWGCWQVADSQYSNQFETSGGLTFRF